MKITSLTRDFLMQTLMTVDRTRAMVAAHASISSTISSASVIARGKARPVDHVSNWFASVGFC